MSLRHWIYAVAFGLISVAAVAQEVGQDDESSEQTATGQDEQQARPSFVVALERIEAAIRDLISEEDQRRSQAEAEQSAADLRAQQEMASWAMEMALAAIVSAIVTFVGLALIWGTLHHTRRAADYAKGMLAEAVKTTAASLDAAAHAERQAKIAEDTFYRIERPYLFPEIVEDIKTHEIDTFPTSLRYTVRNLGRVPCIMVQCQHSLSRDPLSREVETNLTYVPLASGGSWREGAEIPFDDDGYRQGDALYLRITMYYRGGGQEYVDSFFLMKEGEKAFIMVSDPADEAN